MSLSNLNVVPGHAGEVIGGEKDMRRRALAAVARPRLVHVTKWNPDRATYTTHAYLPNGELYNPVLARRNRALENIHC